MATKGRGGDSMLVHMTPGEVQALQTLAERNGGTLTINPETGQPEANFLKKMLPMIAGAALNFFAPGLGSAVGGMFGLGAAAGTGIAVGGITSLATGSLSRGLMAGLGAYGGASLVGGVANAGTGALSSEAGNAALTNAGLTGEAALSPAADEIAQRAIGQKLAATTPYETLSTGVKAVTDSPAALGKFAKSNLGAIGAAASPLMAADTVETTTPRQDTGYIRQKKFNPYTQQYIDLEPVKASEWGSRSFSNYADGGIVALAAGGSPSYFAANPDVAAAYENYKSTYTPEQFAQTHYDTYGKNEGRSNPTAAAAAAPVTAAATSGPAPGSAAYNSMVGNWFSQYPNATAADVQNAITTYGLNADDVRKAMAASGLSAAAQHSAFHSDVGVSNAPQGGLAGLTSNVLNFLKQYPNATQAEIDNAKKVYGYSDADVVRPYEHGYQLASGQGAAAGKYLQDNPDVMAWLGTTEGKKYLANNPEFDPLDIAYTHYERYGKNEGRKWGLTTLPPITSVDTAVNLPGGVSGGGNTVVNPNGTITTAPNIPGRPPGGFTGIGQVKDAYTQGGGSLGQSNLFVPKTLDEMYARYGNTGGSEQAYDYLMGKGAADIKKPVTQSGELMLPYSQAVLGQEIAAASGPATQKFLFDRRTRRYIPNPAYVDPNAPKETSTTEVQQDSTVGGANGGVMRMALGGLGSLAGGGQAGYNLGDYSDGGRLLRGPGDGVSDSIPASIGNKRPARLADGEFVVPARIVSELGNGSTEAGARKLYAMMDRVQKARGKTTGKNRVAANTRSEKYLPA
jgi:hypothetical protein